MNYYREVTQEIYFCHSCQMKPLYLTEVTDPTSSRFDQPCCPYCGSADVDEGEKTIRVFDGEGVINKITAERERLDWDRDKQKQYLCAAYGKRGVSLLDEQQLIAYLQHLEGLP